MKKLITTLLLVISSITFAQEKLKTEWLGYIPMRTYHWDRTNIEKYHPTEGGNIGLVLIRRKIQTDKVYTEKQVGLVRNSFGNLSLIIQQGVGTKLKNITLSMSGGIATGYKDMNTYTISNVWYNNEYKDIYIENDNTYNKLPKIMKDNGIIPTLVFSATYTKWRFKPTINISPSFINGGVTFNIK